MRDKNARQKIYGVYHPIGGHNLFEKLLSIFFIHKIVNLGHVKHGKQQHIMDTEFQ